MKFCLSELSTCVIIIFLARTKGQCQNTPSDQTITTCGESYKSGTNVYIDFQRINSSCTCTAMPLFTGNLLVYFELKTKLYRPTCTEAITVKVGERTVVFNCDGTYPSAITESVIANSTTVKVIQIADYHPGTPSGKFYPCLQLKPNAGNGIVSATCGNSTTIRSSTTSTVLTTEYSSPNINSKDTSTTPATHRHTTVVYPSAQQFTPADSENLTYIITGAVTGCLFLLVIVVLTVFILLRQKGKRKDNAPKTDEVSDHTNRAFDENNGLPDNPLYHSNVAAPVDEVGYSTIQKEQLGLPPTDEANKKKRDPDYDVPPNNKPIKDPEASSLPVYAVPNKSTTNSPEDNQVQAMYAQVSKPRKGPTQVPVQQAD